MEAAHTFGAAEHRGVRSPAIPEELDDSDRDGKADAGNCGQDRHADQTDDGEPELPPLDTIDAAEIGVSSSPIAEAITTAATAALGRCRRRPGAIRISPATMIAPTRPVNWVRARAACATPIVTKRDDTWQPTNPAFHFSGSQDAATL
jgi:hypothetical protein